ncbi:hypothetical protein PAMA_015345 [Pampus argenteus]
MEFAFLTFILVSSFAVDSSHFSITEWDDVVVARKDTPIVLVCNDTTVRGRGSISINWMMKSLDEKDWKLVLSANERKIFYGGSSKETMQLTDPNFKVTGDFSLSFRPILEDYGLYSCLIKQKERKLKEKIILLAFLTVTIIPTAPIPQKSTLRLTANVHPSSAVSHITWVTPGGMLMKSEKKEKVGTVAKLPQVLNSDSGVYVCRVYPWVNSSNPVFIFNVDVIVDDDNVASFTGTIHGKEISSVTLAQTPFHLMCPDVMGDNVLLYWKPPDRRVDMKLVYQYDRWRGSTSVQSKKLKLAGPPYNPEAGSFSFLLTPEVKDGGLYVCDVYLNDNTFSQRTLLSVLKATVVTNQDSSKLTLKCLYSELSKVQSVSWKYQNKSRRLNMLSHGPGIIMTILPLPITSDTAGNYTCTLLLKNGKTVWVTVTLPLKDGSNESHSVTTLYQLPPLSALLLLVPLVAAAVGVLLWRQKHISDRSIEQHLSVHLNEAENIYDNPEDIRQAPPQGSVYMDLKPRGEDDVYKELERYEQCQS